MLEDIGGMLEDNWLPFTLATQTASVLARKQAEAAAVKRRAVMLDMERQRQARYSQQSQQAFDASLNAVTPASMQTGADNALAFRMAAAQRPQGTPDDITSGQYTGVSANAPTVVKEAAARAILSALQKGKDYTLSKARLGAIGDAQLDAGVTLGRSADAINTSGMLSRASSAALPTELAAANQQGQGWRLAHDMLGGASNLGMLYGMGVLNNAKRKVPQVSQGRGSVPVAGALPQE